MTIKGRKALERDVAGANIKYDIQVLKTKELETQVKALRHDIAMVIVVPLHKAVRNLLKMRKQYRTALRKLEQEKSQSG